MTSVSASLPSSPRKANHNGLTRGDRGGLWIILVLASAYALVVLVTGVISALDYGPVFAGGPTGLAVLADAALPTTALDGTATLLDGSFTTASLTVEGLGTGAVTLLVSANIVASLTELILIGAVIFLSIRLLRHRPFLRSVTVAAIIAAATVIIGGITSQTLHGIAQMQVVSELTNDIRSTALLPGFSLDPTPFAVGFGLAVVATAFQVAERLQLDTDGLV
jgi:hypothetical protein